MGPVRSEHRQVNIKSERRTRDWAPAPAPCGGCTFFWGPWYKLSCVSRPTPHPAGAQARRVYKQAGRKTTKLRTQSGSGRRLEPGQILPAPGSNTGLPRVDTPNPAPPRRASVQRSSYQPPPSQRQRRGSERCPATTRRRRVGEPRRRQRKVLETLVSKRRFAFSISRRSPAQRVRREKEEQGSVARNPRQGVMSEAHFATTLPLLAKSLAAAAAKYPLPARRRKTPVPAAAGNFPNQNYLFKQNRAGESARPVL